MTNTLRILQFGSAGQLGLAMIRLTAGRDDTSLRAVALCEADFRYPEQVVDVVRKAGPVDMVLNTTAYTAVDKAESEEGLARMINAVSVGALAQVCAERDVPLIHVSTDYVFDGTKPTPYVETDTPNPLGAYGRTKLEGEEAVRKATGRHVIVRTSWVYSPFGTNFVKTMLRLGKEHGELRIVDDQYGSPTSATDLAAALLCVTQRIVNGEAPGKQQFGTFHYANSGETSWRRFAEAVFEEVPKTAKIKARVVPIGTAEYPTPARRPMNTRLDCSKIENAFSVARPHWRKALKQVLAEIESEQRGPA